MDPQENANTGFKSLMSGFVQNIRKFSTLDHDPSLDFELKSFKKSKTSNELSESETEVSNSIVNPFFQGQLKQKHQSEQMLRFYSSQSSSLSRVFVSKTEDSQQSFNAETLFHQIVDMLNQNNTAESILAILCCDQEVLLSFSLVPYFKIKEQVENLIKKFQPPGNVPSAIINIFYQLYITHLTNGPTKLELDRLNEELPKLKEKTNKNAMGSVIREGRELLEYIYSVEALEPIQISEMSEKVRKMLIKLSFFQELTWYSDPSQTTRLLDLANYEKRSRSDIQHPKVVQELPDLIKRIQLLGYELKEIGELSTNLSNISKWFSQVQRPIATANSSNVQNVNPLGVQDEQVNALIHHYSEFFWVGVEIVLKNLLENSPASNPKLSKVVKSINTENVSIQQLNQMQLLQIWNGYFDEQSFLDIDYNILAKIILKNSDLSIVNELKEYLSSASEKILKYRENHSNENDLSALIEVEKGEIYQHCAEMLLKGLANNNVKTLPSLKKFLGTTVK